MNFEDTWEIGLPVPPKYIGIADKIFYYLSYRIGYFVNLAGGSPNMITTFGLICNICTAISITYDTKHFVGTVFLGTLADTMDGFNARRFNKQSKYGTLIDHGADWVSGVSIAIASFCRWYQYYAFYIIIALIAYLENGNLVYSGFIQEYQGKKDMFLSSVFQSTEDERTHVELCSLLVKYKEYNSSTMSFILVFAFWIMQSIQSIQLIVF